MTKGCDLISAFGKSSIDLGIAVKLEKGIQKWNQFLLNSFKNDETWIKLYFQQNRWSFAFFKIKIPFLYDLKWEN